MRAIFDFLIGIGTLAAIAVLLILLLGMPMTWPLIVLLFGTWLFGLFLLLGLRSLFPRRRKDDRWREAPSPPSPSISRRKSPSFSETSTRPPRR